MDHIHHRQAAVAAEDEREGIGAGGEIERIVQPDARGSDCAEVVDKLPNRYIRHGSRGRACR